MKAGSRFLILWAVLCAALCAVAPSAASAVEGSGDNLARAQVLLDQGFFDHAIAAAGEAVLPAGHSQTSSRVDALILLARAHRMAGRHGKALERLRQAEALVPATDNETAARVALMLGDSLVFLEQPDDAEKYFQKASKLNISGDRGLQARLLNARGNLLMLKKMYGEAARIYRKSLEASEDAGDASTAVRAAINGAKACQAAGDHAGTGDFLAAASRRNAALRDTYEKGYNVIEIALLQHRMSAALSGGRTEPVPGAFQEALRVARAIGNRRLSSQAFGSLGSLHEDAARYDEALDYTRRAVFDAQLTGAAEILFLWHWQSGRILVKQGRQEEAADAYRNAVRSLQAVRLDSAPECKTFNQLPYDSVIEPLYTGFIDLLIRRSASLGEQGGAEALLTEAIEALESMKVAEMQDYLQDNCLAPRQPWKNILGRMGRETAVIYPISLDDRLEIILYAQGRMVRFSAEVGRKAFEDEIHAFRRKLEDRTRREYLINAQTLYDWLMRPLENELAARGIGTIVFIPNGALRTVPLSALHDGRSFLLAKYAVVSAQGFTLIDPGGTKQAGQGALLAGITEAIQGFPALDGVSSELDVIRGIYSGLTLKNQEVTLLRIEHELKEKTYRIVHFATHGEIGDTSQKTFLLAWDGKITMDHFERFMSPNRFRKNPVELLVLSACQTAAGNDRSALGLAGISLKAGASSSVGTLWSVDDRAAAELISQFYLNLKDPSLSRAQSLQRAQLKLINGRDFQHPFYWAPFVIIGSWL